MSVPTDDEIGERVDSVVASILGILDLFGVEIPGRVRKLSDVKRAELVKNLCAFLTTLWQVSQLGEHKADPKEELERLEKGSELMAPICGYPERTYIAEHFYRLSIDIVDSLDSL